MEAKYYQDNQVLAKRSIQELRKVQKKEDQEIMKVKMNAFKEEQEREKQEKRQKNLDHIGQLKEQRQIPKNNFLAKTGVAILNN